MLKASAPKCKESRSFFMLGLYLNKCRTAACFFAEGYPEIKGVCFFKHGLLFRLFLRVNMISGSGPYE
ncbi:hypothetical protein CU084_17285 [Bacillus velezensis]|nr:hypothetical protein CU084_17285 [Bacillus velezensis]